SVKESPHDRIEPAARPEGSRRVIRLHRPARLQAHGAGEAARRQALAARDEDRRLRDRALHCPERPPGAADEEGRRGAAVSLTTEDMRSVVALLGGEEGERGELAAKGPSGVVSQ